jgi:hypothetical protein
MVIGDKIARKLCHSGLNLTFGTHLLHVSISNVKFINPLEQNTWLVVLLIKTIANEGAAGEREYFNRTTSA